MGVIEKSKAAATLSKQDAVAERLCMLAAATLSKQDAVAERLCMLADAFVADEENASIDYLKAEELYRQYGEAYHRLQLAILQLQGMKYEMEDMKEALQLN